MPLIKGPAEVEKLKSEMRTPHTRVIELRQIVDRRMNPTLDQLSGILAPDYQKSFIPSQTGVPGKSLARLTNIMASNATELRIRVRSTDTAKINLGQKKEHAHEAIDEKLFPQTVKRKMRQFLADGYTIVALDVLPGHANLADYADRKELESYAESELDEEPEDSAPQSTYRRAYRGTDATKSARERHEAAYGVVTDDAMVADGLNLRARVIDPETFDGFQVDGDPNRFAIGMEYGKKPLSPLLAAFEGWGLKVEDGQFVIDPPEGSSARKGKRKTASYQALGAGLLPDVGGSSNPAAETYINYTQVRTCEQTIVYLEHPNGKRDKSGEKGVVLKVPNLFGGTSTGYYLIEGDAKLRAGVLEDRYDPPLLALLVACQKYNIFDSAEGAMALNEATREPYLFEESQSTLSSEPFDTTSETKAPSSEDGATIPTTTGKLLRAETTGIKIREYVSAALEELQRQEPTLFPAGAGSSSESALHLAGVQTSVLTELSPYQANVAEVCKRMHEDIDQYVIASKEPIRLAYVASGAPKGAKAEIRELTPEMAKLPTDMDYEIAASTPQADAAQEVMSERRMASNVYGITTHRETIGIKDPTREEQMAGTDKLVQRLLGNDKVPGILEEAYDQVMREYIGQKVRAGLGQPPALVGPDGVTPIGTGAPPAPVQAPRPAASVATPQGFAGAPAMGGGAAPISV